MTDKQIMINGVDVSGCKHYKNQSCIADYCLTDMPFGEAKCELNTNCYYKQLKRKEQEYKRLSSLIRETQTYSDVCCVCRDEILIYPSISGRRDYSQIEVEEISLKKIIQQFNQLKAENEILKEKLVISSNSDKKTLKIIQTLTEIKEIMKKHCRKCKKHKFYYFQLCCTCKYTEILQKISEVQDAN